MQLIGESASADEGERITALTRKIQENQRRNKNIKIFT